MGHRDAIDPRFPRGRIVNHRIPTGVIGSCLSFLGVSLLGSQVNLATLANVVARVKLCLRGKPGHFRANFLVCIDDDLQCLCLRIELDEIRVMSIFGGTNVTAIVLAFDD